MEDRTHIPVNSERAWQDQANCLGVDPDLFFPERGASTREAKEVCRGCVVKNDCLEYALDNGEKFGIWGGSLSESVADFVVSAPKVTEILPPLNRCYSVFNLSSALLGCAWPKPIRSFFHCSDLVLPNVIF